MENCANTNVFLAFSCISWDWVFSVRIGRHMHYTQSHPVFKILLIFLQSHDLLAINVQGTKAHSLSQSKQQKTKGIANFKNMIYYNSVALFTIYSCIIIHIKYEHNFNYILLLEQTSCNTHSLARKFFHLTPKGNII